MSSPHQTFFRCDFSGFFSGFSIPRATLPFPSPLLETERHDVAIHIPSTAMENVKFHLSLAWINDDRSVVARGRRRGPTLITLLNLAVGGRGGLWIGYRLGMYAISLSICPAQTYGFLFNLNSMASFHNRQHWFDGTSPLVLFLLICSSLSLLPTTTAPHCSQTHSYSQRPLCLSGNQSYLLT